MSIYAVGGRAAVFGMFMAMNQCEGALCSKQSGSRVCRLPGVDAEAGASLAVSTGQGLVGGWGRG